MVNYKPQTVHVKLLKQSLDHLGLKRLLRPLLSQIDLWVRSCGEEWTVSRLKEYKLSLIQLRADQPVDHTNWVTREISGIPKGVFKQVFVKGLQSSRNMRYALTIMQFYTTFISKTLTESQKLKACAAISDKGTRKSYPDLEQAGAKHKKKFARTYKPTFSFAGWTTSKPTMVKRDMHPWMSSFFESAMQDTCVTPILKSMGVPLQPYMIDTNVSGQISVIQEKGYKARVIASPSSAIQVAFKPLHLALGSILKQLKTDCTHDQIQGPLWAQEQLKMGKRMWSVDLSSATDRFPLNAQLAVLKGLSYQWTSAFEHVCRNTVWKSEVHDGSYVLYGAGQPMGLYGSFALFALTHNLLLQSLGGTPDTYRVLGDDVMISDESLFIKYKAWLEDNDVPISWHKSIINSRVAEFAGYLITKDSLIKGVKYPQGLLDPYSWVQLSKISGVPLMSLVPKKFHKFALQLASLPTSIGGAGLNPLGIPTLERVAGFSTSLESPSVPKLYGPNRRLIPPMVKLAPGTQPLVEFLDDQSRHVIDDARASLPLLSKVLDDSAIAAMYFAVSRKGVPLYESAVDHRSARVAWTNAMIKKVVKPVWQGSWD